MSAKTQQHNILLAIAGLVAAVVVVGLIGFFTLGQTKEIIQGEVEVSEFRVSSKLPGRIVELRVKEGDYVHVGDTLAVLEIPEANAQEKVAQATQGAAEAISNLTDAGARKETILSAFQLYQQAQAAAEVAHKTYTRMQNLFDEGVMSAQKRDEALAAYKVCEAQVKVAKNQYEIAKSGARSQEKTVAMKNAEAAKSAVDVVMNDMWGSFNIREDQLNGMKVGDTFTAFSPAFNKSLRMKVFYIKDEGSYAVWKATKSNGQYDLKTFEVKARPLNKFEGLRPGMSLIIK